MRFYTIPTMITLRPYQDAGKAFFDDADGAFWAMEMRLGKSITCIRWLVDHPRDPQLIAVVAPKTVLIAWEKEVREDGHPVYAHWDGSVAKRKKELSAPEPGFHLLNYESIPKLAEELAQFDAIVFDESTRIKNAAAQVTKTALQLSKIIPIRCALSGLPNPEGWEDVWSQMAVVNGGSWMGHSNFWTWRNTYAKRYGFEWVIGPKSQSTIRQAFHAGAYVLTRKQAGIRDVKIRQRRTGTMPPATRQVYERVSAKWEHPDGRTAKQAMVVGTWLRQICGGSVPNVPNPWKAEELLRIIIDELPTESIVVWFSFNHEIFHIWNLLKQKAPNISACWITGVSTQEERAERMQRFQSGQRRVMLIQQACGQYGIDLSAADTAVYYSSTYRYELRAQSEDRIYKVGKPNDLLCIDLVTEDSADEVVLDSVAEKKSDASYLMAKLNLKPPKE